jgi:hypothetical protein
MVSNNNILHVNIEEAYVLHLEQIVLHELYFNRILSIEDEINCQAESAFLESCYTEGLVNCSLQNLDTDTNNNNTKANNCKTPILS